MTNGEGVNVELPCAQGAVWAGLDRQPEGDHMVAAAAGEAEQGGPAERATQGRRPCAGKPPAQQLLIPS